MSAFDFMVQNLLSATAAEAALPKQSLKSDPNYRPCPVDGCGKARHKTAGGNFTKRCTQHNYEANRDYQAKYRLEREQDAAGRNARVAARFAS